MNFKISFFFTLVLLSASCEKKVLSNKSDEFRVGLASEPLTWDWTKAKDLSSLGVLDNLVKPLVNIEHTENGDFKVKPGLLKNWVQNKSNRKIWSFEISIDKKWSDGSLVTLKEISESLNSLIKREDDLLCSSEIDQIESVRLINGDKRLEIKTKVKLNLLPRMLSMLCFSPVKNEVPKSWDFIGTGDFRVKDYKPGKTMVLERVGEPDIKKINKIKLVFTNSWHAALKLFENEDVDFVPVVPVDQIEMYKGSKFLYSEKSLTTSFVVLNDERAPFDKLSSRKLLKELVNSSNFEKVLTGFFKSKYFVPDAYINKNFFEEAAYSTENKKFDQVTVELPIVDHTNYKLTAQYLQSILKPYGLNLNIKLMDWKSLFHELDSKKPSLYFRSWTSHWGHPVEFLSLIVSSIGQSDNAEYKELLKSSWSADKIHKKSKSVELIKKIQDEQVLVIPLFQHKQYYLMSDSYKSFKASPLLKFNFGSVETK